MNAHDVKFDKIRNMLKDRRVLVAFSGGVDSTVLAHISRQSAEETALLTVDSITFSQNELQLARTVADELGISLKIVEVDELANEDLVKNPVDRCYHCKKELAIVWLQTADDLGMDMVVDGTNASDMQGHRPGAKALEEAGVISPFKVAGISKDEIRDYARSNGLSVAERPSMACLSSRFPYGTEITEERILMVDKVEQAVRDQLGIDCVRARYHGEVVRIEIGREDRPRVFDTTKLDIMHEIGKTAGFKYVTLDCYGYRTGAMDEVLDSKEGPDKK
ncbi:MAG: ATP-dependent sacrificial sulfur transferase LarE [Candidatus Thorarchaeota archaeon]